MKKSILVLLGVCAAQMALAGGFEYSCASLPGRGGGPDVDITVNSKTVRVHSEEQGLSQLRFTAARFAKYKPKGNPNKVAYKGVQHGNRRMVVVSKDMLIGGMKLRNGKLGGFIQIRGSEDSYWSTDYVCYAK